MLLCVPNLTEWRRRKGNFMLKELSTLFPPLPSPPLPQSSFARDIRLNDQRTSSVWPYYYAVYKHGGLSTCIIAIWSSVYRCQVVDHLFERDILGYYSTVLYNIAF